MRILLLVFACLALPLAVHAQQVDDNSRGQQRPAQGQSPPKASLQPAIPPALAADIKRIAEALETANQKQPSHKEVDRAERDVIAQETMADQTKNIFGLAIADVLLTLAGLGFVWKTLRDNRRATEDDIRPYVQISHCKFQLIPGTFRMIVTVQNSGQTPATFFEVHFNALAVPKGGVLDAPADLKVIRWNALGGGDSVTVGIARTDFEVPRASVSDANGAMNFFVVGKVRYGDIWDGVYETEFAYFTPNVTQTYTNFVSQKVLKKQYRKMSRSPGHLRTFVKVGGPAKRRWWQRWCRAA